ncbi:MAG: hypothetical protein IJ159_00505 [Prevotella sp.]|nr:hypothetical protein [Prevotella sp.]
MDDRGNWHYLFTICVVLLSFAFIACGNNEEDDGSNNTTDVAVTGKVTEYGFSFATVEGYLNLQLIDVTYSNYTVGIEYALNESFNNCKRADINEMSGNKITVLLNKLKPKTKYYYRTFVEVNKMFYYGKSVKSFTTKEVDIEKLLSIRRINQTDPITVDIICNISKYDQKNTYQVGVKCSNKEITTNNTPIQSTPIQSMSTNIAQLKNDSCLFNITYLYPDSTYYVTPFIICGDSLLYGKSKKHEIPGISKLLTTGKIFEQHIWEATFYCSTSIKKLYPDARIEYSVCIDESPESRAYITDNNYYHDDWQKTNFVNEMNYYSTLDFSAVDSKPHYYHACARINHSFVVVAQGKTFTYPQLQSGNIDLGLSCLWASNNIGALTPENNGEKYRWGCVDVESWPKDSGLEEISNTTYDAAYVNLGEPMRMPTQKEFQELLSCQQHRLSYNGKPGFLFTGPNGNSIFLPCKGYNRLYIGLTGTFDGYWSGTRIINNDRRVGAYCILPYSYESFMDLQKADATANMHIRPVCNKR